MPDAGAVPAQDTPAQIAALMRSYLVFFLPWAFRVLHPGEEPLKMHWYLWAMCQAFQLTAIGKTKRLVINLPPRNLKSITSVAYTAWLLGNNPKHKIMLVTYGSSLVKEHIENCRVLMSHPFYQLLFPGTRLKPGGKGHMLRTTLGGGCRSITVGGATTGHGADTILIDDAMKAEDIASEARREELERFYSGTLITRLNNKRRGVVVSIQQRLGEDDLPGRLIDAGAEHLCLPAYDDKEVIYDIGFGRRYRRAIGEVLRPDAEDRETLDRIRREMGPHKFATQFLQQPCALEGNIIRTDAFARFDLNAYERRNFHKIVQSWDLATSEDPKADWSVCMTFGFLEERWYLLDVVRERMGYARLRDRVLAQNNLWRADKVLLEDAGAGTHLWQDFWEGGQLRPFRVRPTADKVTRMVGQLAYIEDGRLLIPREAPWLPILLSEFRSFPDVSHDDQVDALSQFLIWVKTHPNFGPTEYDPQTGRRLRTIRRPSRRR